MKQRRTILGTFGVATIFLGTAVAGSAAAADPDTLAEAVTVEGITQHLEAFQDIADANGGNRAVGTPGYEASAAYIESVLAEAGYTTSRQAFDVVIRDVDFDFTVTGQDGIVGIPMSNTPVTGPTPITAELVAPTDPLGCDAAAWAGADAVGKIAVVSRGTCSFGEKSIAAGAAGAIGAVIYNNEPAELNGTLGDIGPAYVPTIGITQAAGAAIIADLVNAPEATLRIEEEVETIPTFNVIAETTTGRDDNTVMLGAHLDGVPEGAGINDNGSGSAAILETAVQLAEQGELNNQVRFAWWAAEEIGLLGSAHYVDDLLANDPEEIDQIATYLNFDMVASPNYVISVYDADQSTYEAPVVVPEGSTATEDVFTDYFDSVEQPWIDTAFDGRSDYDAFIANDIPASGLFTGADDIKTADEAALFGGVVGEQHDQNYHTAGDDISNINTEALDIMSNAIAYATASLANDTSAVNGVAAPVEPAAPAPTVPVAPAPTVPVAPAPGAAPANELAATGTETSDLLLALGSGVLALGAAALVIGRRREAAHQK
ncbi:M20/M25/M40 family metallo-hydrolase [Marisediminicola senii]|uniref:M20/M25/M40 family metallo-hydrolase n=1 Tax=Marisediminicola senii TaxID=2711233 RepID=UPI00191267AF|nr:M20/M25/M40 family metallo-hydrolase [Marisediminicola senii]